MAKVMTKTVSPVLPARTEVVPGRYPHCPGGERPTYSFKSAPRVPWNPNRKKFRPPDEVPPPIPYGNMMYDRRVVRGPAFMQHPVATIGQESQAARQAEARRRAMARRKAQSHRSRALRLRLGTPPPVEGRKHEDVQTDLYLEEIFDHPVEMSIGTQTDYFIDRPPSPKYIPCKTGVDVSTQIYPGELFHFDTEVRPILEVLVGKTMEQSLMEVLEEDELAALREQQRIYKEAKDAEVAEQQRLEEQERRNKEEMEARVREQEEAVFYQKETEDRVAASVITTGYIADLLPSVLTGLKEAGYLYDDIKEDVDEDFMEWLLSEVKTEMKRVVEDRDFLLDMVKEIIETRAELYRATGAEEDSKIGHLSEEEVDEPMTPREVVEEEETPEEEVPEPKAAPVEEPPVGEEAAVEEVHMSRSATSSQIDWNQVTETVSNKLRL